MPINYRLYNTLAASIALALLVAGFYLEYTQRLLPCSLCILQRGVYIALVIVLFAAAIPHRAKAMTQVYGLLTLLIATAGILLAARQVWLQSLPKAPTEICLPGFSYMVQHLPLTQALQLMLLGSDNCGLVSWRLEGWSIAAWSLLCFIGFALQGLSQLWFAYTAKHSQQQ